MPHSLCLHLPYRNHSCVPTLTCVMFPLHAAFFYHTPTQNAIKLFQNHTVIIKWNKIYVHTWVSSAWFCLNSFNFRQLGDLAGGPSSVISLVSALVGCMLSRQTLMFYGCFIVRTKSPYPKRWMESCSGAMIENCWPEGRSMELFQKCQQLYHQNMSSKVPAGSTPAMPSKWLAHVSWVAFRCKSRCKSSVLLSHSEMTIVDWDLVSSARPAAFDLWPRLPSKHLPGASAGWFMMIHADSCPKKTTHGLLRNPIQACFDAQVRQKTFTRHEMDSITGMICCEIKWWNEKIQHDITWHDTTCNMVMQRNCAWWRHLFLKGPPDTGNQNPFACRKHIGNVLKWQICIYIYFFFFKCEIWINIPSVSINCNGLTYFNPLIQYCFCVWITKWNIGIHIHVN